MVETEPRLLLSAKLPDFTVSGIVTLAQSHVRLPRLQGVGCHRGEDALP